MSIPPVVRVFFAIDLSEKLKQQIGGYIGTLKKESKSNAIRWSKPENLHITLQFLAKVATDDLPLLIHHVRQQVEGAFKKTTIAIGDLQLFPNPFRPRVITLDVLPQDSLAELSLQIGRGIEATGYLTEDRRFRAHLTLGRIKHPETVKLKFLEAMPLLDIEPLLIDEVVLFRSEPTPQGSKYTPLDSIALAGASPARTQCL